MSKKYFIFPANYLNFNFDRLFSESTNGNGDVLWPMKEKDPGNIEVDDICYIYYSNLPDGTGRIVLRGTIAAKEKKDAEGVKCYVIKDVETINWNNAGKTKFTREALAEYGVKMNLNKRQLKDDRFAEGKTLGDKALCEKLEDCFNRNIGRLNLKDLETVLTKKLRCAFDRGDDNSAESKNHTTFKTRYGLNYFEIHHLVQQHIGKGNAQMSEAIYDERNLIYLCPTCHRKIHYGRKEHVRRMLGTLYNRQANFYNNNFIQYANSQGFATVIEWLYDMYKVGEDVTHVRQ